MFYILVILKLSSLIMGLWIDIGMLIIESLESESRAYNPGFN